MAIIWKRFRAPTCVWRNNLHNQDIMNKPRKYFLKIVWNIWQYCRFSIIPYLEIVSDDRTPFLYVSRGQVLVSGSSTQGPLPPSQQGGTGDLHAVQQRLHGVHQLHPLVARHAVLCMARQIIIINNEKYELISNEFLTKKTLAKQRWLSQNLRSIAGRVRKITKAKEHNLTNLRLLIIHPLPPVGECNISLASANSNKHLFCTNNNNISQSPV